jgi:hypothetical protein
MQSGNSVSQVLCPAADANAALLLMTMPRSAVSSFPQSQVAQQTHAKIQQINLEVGRCLPPSPFVVFYFVCNKFSP